MKRLIPLTLSVLTSCGPQTEEECMRETQTELAKFVHPDELTTLSTAICTHTKIALDLNQDGTSSEICAEKTAEDAQCSFSTIKKDTSCEKAFYEKVKHSLNEGDAIRLAGYVCWETENAPAVRIDADLDGYSTATHEYEKTSSDCNDSNPNVHRYAEEICDGLDNDCDGFVDIDGARTNGGTFWYDDEDGDGYGKIEEDTPSVYVCNGQEAPKGKTKDPHPDCNDNDPQINVIPEIADDKKDNDCDGLIDEQFPTLPSSTTEPRADFSYEYHTTPNRLVVQRPLQKSWDQVMSQTMDLMTPRDEYQQEFLENSFSSFRDESVSPAVLSDLYPMRELYPTFKQAPHEVCNWASPIVGARFSSLLPAAQVGTKEMIDHAQFYLALYPEQEAKEDSYLATLNENTCKTTFGYDGECENYFIEYRPGSKWEKSQAKISAFRADYDLYLWRAEKSTEELRTFSDLPPDRYRGVEAFLYRRIKDGVDPRDLLYCANGLEAQIKANH